MKPNSSINTVGVLTSGGDAPGMNAVIRSVVRACAYYNLKIMGVRKGYQGLIYGDIFELSARDVSDTLQMGGTFLQTARCLEFKESEYVKQAVDVSKYFGIDALVIIGGDGSFRGGKALSEFGMPVMCIPGTIDNDIPYTEYTVGFDTAVNTAMDAVDKIRDTASSHERCNIIEVMGRHCGNIAMRVGVTTGAEAVIVPEVPFNFDEILKLINDAKKRGKKHFIVILAEGVGGAIEMSKQIQDKVGIESKVTTLGYVQRGGSPTAMDRFVASQMGVEAVKLFVEGKSNLAIGMKDNNIFSIDISEALEIERTHDTRITDLLDIVSI